MSDSIERYTSDGTLPKISDVDPVTFDEEFHHKVSEQYVWVYEDRHGLIRICMGMAKIREACSFVVGASILGGFITFVGSFVCYVHEFDILQTWVLLFFSSILLGSGWTWLCDKAQGICFRPWLKKYMIAHADEKDNLVAQGQAFNLWLKDLKAEDEALNEAEYRDAVIKKLIERRTTLQTHANDFLSRVQRVIDGMDRFKRLQRLKVRVADVFPEEGYSGTKDITTDVTMVQFAEDLRRECEDLGLPAEDIEPLLKA